MALRVAGVYCALRLRHADVFYVFWIFVRIIHKCHTTGTRGMVLAKARHGAVGSSLTLHGEANKADGSEEDNNGPSSVCVHPGLLPLKGQWREQ